MESKDIRHKNFMHLIGDMKQKDFAEKAEMSTAHVSQIVRGFRNIGNTLARKLEISLDLPPGWMDTLHEETANDNMIREESPDYMSNDDWHLLGRISREMNTLPYYQARQPDDKNYIEDLRAYFRYFKSTQEDPSAEKIKLLMQVRNPFAKNP